VQAKASLYFAHCWAQVSLPVGWPAGALAGWCLGGALALWLASVGALGYFWRGQTRRWLVFDGERWLLGAPDAEDRPTRLAPLMDVRVAFDAQRHLLLSARAEGAGPLVRRWLWAARQAAPQHWHLLRSALYSPAAPAGGEPAEPAV
jgi:hypothetical protein